jgi:hypothetical protein
MVPTLRQKPHHCQFPSPPAGEAEALLAFPLFNVLHELAVLGRFPQG